MELISPKSFSCNTKAQKMAGMESKKENSPACSRSTPHKRAPAMVLPERETPGRTPKPWARPIPSPCKGFTPQSFPSPVDFASAARRFFRRRDSMVSEKISKPAVTKNPTQMYFTSMVSTTSDKTIPKMPVTTVPSSSGKS